MPPGRGSVLTSYVGVCGLFERMAGDNCLPDVFGYLLPGRGTPYVAIVTFLFVCLFMAVSLNGDIVMLSDMYSLAFLLVMALFALCGLWLKITRPQLPRKINSN